MFKILTKNVALNAEIGLDRGGQSNRPIDHQVSTWSIAPDFALD